MERITYIEQYDTPCFRFDVSVDPTSLAPWIANRETRVPLSPGRMMQFRVALGERIGELAIGVVADDGTIIGRTPFTPAA